MSDENNKEIKSDWSVKDLPELERSNLLGFFSLAMKVDKRVNPHLYARHSNTDDTERSI